jgi:hypothetical protein
MKKVSLAIVILCLSLSLAAQSAGKRSRGGTTPVATSLAASPVVLPDVNTALVDLDRVSQATQSDIAGVHIDKWKSGWRTAFLKRGVHKQQAEKAAASLQKNLTDALPGLIRDVQNSRGSVSSTFKLYDDLSLVCELLDSLVSATESYGKKDEYGPLADDFSALIRIRRDLSTYVQQAAASVETRGTLPYAAASSPSATSGRLPKKIVVDDTIPEKKPAKKKPEVLSNID